jgi:hypothetical protein
VSRTFLKTPGFSGLSCLHRLVSNGSAFRICLLSLTALAGAEPVTGAQHPAVQRLQFFLSESRWETGAGQCPLQLLLADPVPRGTRRGC